MNLKLGLAYSLLILTALAVGLGLVSAAVSQVNAEAIHPFWQPVVIAFQAFFAKGYVIIAVTWITNISALAIVYTKMKASEYPEIAYNAWKFYGTLAMILGVGAAVFSTLPAPFGQIALVISAVVKIVETSISKVTPRNTQPTVTAKDTGPGPPKTT